MTTPPAVKGVQRQVLTSVFLTIFLDLVGFGMFIPVIPLVARTFGASDAAAVSIASFFSLGTFLAVAVLGRLSDRLGRRKILLVTIAISTLAQFLTGLAQSYAVLLAVRFLAGIASGNISVAQACISDVTRPQERGRSMALIGMAFGLGFSLGPGLGALVSILLPNSSLLGISLVAVALNLFNLIFVARRLPETHSRLATGQVGEWVRSIKTAGAEEGLAGQPGSSWWQDIKRLVSARAFRIVLLLGFLQVFGFIGVEAILSLLLQDAFLIVNRQAQYGAFLYIGLMLILVNGAIARPLLGKWGEIRTLNLGQLLLAVSMIGLPLAAPHLPSLYILLALLAAGSALANPSISSLTSRLAPQAMQGFALGTSQTLGAFARIVGPLTFGFLYQALHGPRSLYISAGLIGLGWVVAVFGLRSTQREFADEKARAIPVT